MTDEPVDPDDDAPTEPGDPPSPAGGITPELGLILTCVAMALVIAFFLIRPYV